MGEGRFTNYTLIIILILSRSVIIKVKSFNFYYSRKWKVDKNDKIGVKLIKVFSERRNYRWLKARRVQVVVDLGQKGFRAA